MKKLILVILCFLVPGTSFSAISRITGQDARGTGTNTASATYPGATTSGNLLIATSFGGVACSACSIGGWSTGHQQEFGTSNRCGSIFYKQADGTETTITVTCTGAATTKIHIYEYQGNATPIVTDGDNGKTGSAATTNWSKDITTTNADDLIFVSNATSGNITNPGWTDGFSLLQADAASIRLFDGDLIVSATGVYSSSATWTSANGCGTSIVAFEAAAAPGGSATPQRTLTGVGL